MKVKVGIRDRAGVIIHDRPKQDSKEKGYADSGKVHSKNVRQEK